MIRARFNRRRESRPLIMAFFLVTAVGALPCWGEPPDVFQPADMPQRNVRLGQHIVQFQPAFVNVSILSSATPETKLALNVFPDVSFVGVVDQADCRGELGFTIAGYLEGLAFSSFMIVIEEDVAVGTVRAPTIGRLFEVRYVDGGVHLISEIDSTLLPSEADPLPTGEPPIMEPLEKLGRPTSEEWEPSGGASRADPCQRPAPVFDVMIFYTSLARDAVGGTSAINALCQWAVDQNNRIYDNSQVNVRMRLVYRGPISYDEDGSDQEHIDRLTAKDDGVMDGVHALRDDYGADFVSLLVDDDQTSGIGWCSVNEDMAFSVVNWQYVTPKFTVSHEIGHNLGCQHNRENNNPSGCNLYSYSFGWHYEGDSGTEHGTVMSYLGTRIPSYSNPDVYFDGHRTGVPIGDEDEAHNAETIRQRRSACEGFRGTHFETWVDFDALPIGFGTFDFPYDTLATGVDELFTVPSGSVLPELWIKNGATDETLTISKRMVIRNCGGTVRIGAQP